MWSEARREQDVRGDGRVDEAYRRIGVPESILTCTIRELRSEAGRELDDTGISVMREAYQHSGRVAQWPGHSHCRTRPPAPPDLAHISYTPRYAAALYFEHLSGN